MTLTQENRWSWLTQCPHCKKSVLVVPYLGTTKHKCSSCGELITISWESGKEPEIVLKNKHYTGKFQSGIENKENTMKSIIKK